MPVQVREAASIITIDPDGCVDKDDGFWIVKRPDGGVLLRDVVSNVAEVIEPWSKEARTAAKLGFTRYRHDGHADWHMLPKHQAIRGCSLTEGQIRPGVIFNVPFGPALDIGSPEIGLGPVRNVKALSYEEADGLMFSDSSALSGMLRMAYVLGLKLQFQRLRCSSWLPDLTGYPTVEQVRKLRYLSREHHWQLSHLPVMEFNILMNRLLGQWAHQRGIPMLCRNHHGRWVIGEDDGSSQLLSKETFLGLTPRQRRKAQSERAYYSPVSVAHVGLGVPFYAPVSRAIRELPSLVNQQQFVAEMRGEHLPFTATQLREIGTQQMTVEQAYQSELRAARREERRRQREAEMAVWQKRAGLAPESALQAAD